MQTKEEMEKAILEAHQTLRSLMQEYHASGIGTVDELHYAYYYTPNKIIVEELISELDCFYQKKNPSQKERQSAGYKLEELALAVFYGLRGWSSIKNYQSSTAQYDLLMSGSGLDWQTTLDLLPLSQSKSLSSVVVEAKAIKSSVSDAQFSRLCSIMQSNHKKTSVLGIFLTLNGASGFSSKKAQRKIGSSRLRQLIFYAETSKPIVVLDIHDIRKLSENGSLLRIIERKIKDIEEQTGLPVFSEPSKEVLLPKNLEELYKKLDS